MLGSSLEEVRAPDTLRQGHQDIIKVALHTEAHAGDPRKVMVTPLPQHPTLHPGYKVQPIQPIANISRDEDGGYYISVLIEWTSDVGRISPGTPLVSVQIYDEAEYEIQSLHWIPPAVDATDSQETKQALVAQARTDALVLLNTWAADAGALDRSSELMQPSGMMQRISTQCDEQGNPLQHTQGGQDRVRATTVLQQLHAARWARYLLQQPELMDLQEPRQVTHMLLIAINLVMGAPSILYPLLSDEQWGSTLKRILRKDHKEWNSARAAAAHIFKLGLAGAAGWDKGMLHDLPAIAHDGTLIPQPSSTAACPRWQRLRMKDTDIRSQWWYDHGDEQVRGEGFKMRFSTHVWRRIFCRGDTLKVTSDINAHSSVRVRWVTTNIAPRDPQQRLEAAIQRTLLSLPEGPKSEATDASINLISTQRTEAELQLAAEIQDVQDATHKRYDEVLMEAEAKDNKPGRDKKEFMPEGTDSTHCPVPGMKKETHWLGPEAKAPDPDITLSDQWWEPHEHEELYKLWHEIPADKRRYIAAVKWGESPKDLLPPPEQASKELVEMYEHAARKLVHTLVIQLGIGFTFVGGEVQSAGDGIAGVQFQHIIQGHLTLGDLGGNSGEAPGGELGFLPGDGQGLRAAFKV